jgi:hypothetical protein
MLIVVEQSAAHRYAHAPVCERIRSTTPILPKPTIVRSGGLAIAGEVVEDVEQALSSTFVAWTGLRVRVVCGRKVKVKTIPPDP